MDSMMDLLKKVYPLRLAPVSSDTDRAVEIFHEELPFTVHEYASGTDVNGWVVPMKWAVIKAEIRHKGRLVYDGAAHPLGVIGYSQSFRGKLPLDELKKHIYSRQDQPAALTYHYKYFYRTWERDWGFSLPFTMCERLEPGEYDVDLQTLHEPGAMKVLEYLIRGRSNDTITFIAHNCHAAQANDDISGAVVGVELMKRLAKRENRYTYRLLIGPEQYCSVFFLDSLAAEERKSCRWGIYLEMLGNDQRLALQESFHGDTELDHAARHALAQVDPNLYVGAFRKVVGNDETVWEAPGYEIPTISISRSNPVTEGLPYPEYHTDLDNEDLIHPRRLEDAVAAVEKIIFILENNTAFQRRFEGLLALSNPRYDLYLEAPADPAYLVTVEEMQRRWFDLLVRLPRYFNGKVTLLDMAEEHDLPFEEVLQYVRKYEEKELIERVFTL